MRRLAVLTGCVCSVALIAVGGAGSATSKSAFLVFVEPTITAASNGLTLETELEGSFDVADKTASGSGDFAVMNGATELEHGTFTLTRLVAFQFYGCGLPGLPDACGGRAILRVALTPRGTSLAIPALLQINCLIGNPPSGMDEGVRLNVPGVNNFNKSIHGETLFFRT